MAPKIVFYARVSKRDQKPDSQIAAARRLGVRDHHIFVEKASGARHDRPVLDKALTALEKGDTLACFKLDRLGRSLAHLVEVFEDLEARGVHFMTAEDGLSTKGTTGKLVLNILGSIAQFAQPHAGANPSWPGGGQSQGSDRWPAPQNGTSGGHQSPADAEQG
jgi:DNA invertase Pin-like site-specific DNA recombinase